MFIGLAVVFTLTFCGVALAPFFLKRFREMMSEGSVLHDADQIRKMQDQLVLQMLRDEQFLKNNSLSEKEFRRRQEALTFRYVDYGLRLDALKENS